MTLARLLALAVAAGLIAAVLTLSAEGTEGRALGLSLAFGAAFGVVLQRSRFCFLCHARDLVESRDPRGALAILVALAVGTLGYVLVLGAWLPVPLPERLPPDAHVGPVGPVLAVAAFVFGLGMAISGSCVSAHLYRLGEGSPTAPFALLGTLVGFALGFLTWNTAYVASVAEAPPLWLPHSLGYAGTLGLTLALLAGLAVAALARSRLTLPARPATPVAPAGLARAIFVERWPAWVGGAAVGVISAASYLRVGPLGVTAELGSLARTGAGAAGLLPETLYGLDGLRGCATALKTALLSKNGLFVGGLVAASFASALAAGQFRPSLPRRDEVLRGLAGGVLMGWGAMLALGCTVGVLLSGIHAGAVAGWVFLVACFAGVLAGLWARRAVAGASRRTAHPAAA